ncbi:MAG: hypothetical protein ISN28_15860 [Ectothiorhodospiraceae bacterium AqS1]|nr:hypothetical protein [Ectothiorhodospiraceae bacterium AqS1]
MDEPVELEGSPDGSVMERMNADSGCVDAIGQYQRYREKAIRRCPPSCSSADKKSGGMRK